MIYGPKTVPAKIENPSEQGLGMVKNIFLPN